jgi:hypothetical protein
LVNDEAPNIKPEKQPMFRSCRDCRPLLLLTILFVMLAEVLVFVPRCPISGGNG